MIDLLQLLGRAWRFAFSIPIRIYRLIISPALPASCIYYPSCSHYAQNAVMKHGALKGSILALARIGRCNARFRGGVDYVPDIFHFRRVRWRYRFFSRRGSSSQPGSDDS